jgi:hypothetical protein
MNNQGRSTQEEKTVGKGGEKMKIQSLGSRWNVLEAIVQHLGCCNICAQRSHGEGRERPPIGTRALGTATTPEYSHPHNAADYSSIQVVARLNVRTVP